MRLSPALLALLVAVPAARAQEQFVVFTALPVLDVPAVPEMGGATVGRLADDARSFLQNPAALALAPAGQAAVGTPSAVWFGESRIETAAASWTSRVRRLALGVGAAQGEMSGDARTLGDGTPFDPTDRFRALSASVATAGAVRAAFGATARMVTSTDAPVYDGARFTVGRLRGMTADVGALVTADVARLAGSPRVGWLSPALDVTAGYAQTHIGGAVKYSGFAGQPLPRTGALGWSARAGLDTPVAGRALRLVEVEGAFGAERRLARPSGLEGGVTYAPLMAGVGIADALAGTGTDLTTGRRGVRLGLAETLSVAWGTFDGGGFRSVATRSVEVRTAGVFALAAGRLRLGSVGAALARVDLRVGRTTVFAGSPDATSRTTFSLVVRR
ncbi:MAG TPA: hypothetical protein VGB53_06955 [Rubricoccaceae bacterium]|jgi:hypothetical protein